MGKKFFRTLLLAFLFAVLTHASASAETARVTGNDVNMREGPGTEFRIVDCLPRGAYVTVTDRSSAPWYCVDYDGTVGFMSANFLEIAEEESAQPVISQIPQDILDQCQEGYVDAMYVRFRSAPGSEYSVLGEYNRGKSLLYFKTFGDWAACIIDGRPGYLYADYIALGRFPGWGAANTGNEDKSEDETGFTVPDEFGGQHIPMSELIQSLPTPTPAANTPTPSDQLALEHASTPGVEQTPGYINANYVRFRKGPASSYPIIETYNAGTVMGVTGVYMDWTACIIDDQFGFIYSDYVTIPEQTPAVEQPAQQTTTTTVNEEVTPMLPLVMPEVMFDDVDGYVSGNNVRMRAAPTMSAPIVKELSYGNTLKIVGRTDDWAAVICGNAAGYIYGSYVKVGALGIANVGSGAGAVVGGLSGSSYEKGQQIAQYAVQFVRSPGSGAKRRPCGSERAAAGRHPLLLLRLELHRPRRHLHRLRHVCPCPELRHRRRHHRACRSLLRARLRGPQDRVSKENRKGRQKETSFCLPFLRACVILRKHAGLVYRYYSSFPSWLGGFDSRTLLQRFGAFSLYFQGFAGFSPV